ncbi:hypothetical protein SAMN04487959_109140 [Modicisalibacter xianhensis]|uniref:Uncharacterized protein n=2 Tax=Modicisalibacter xianhensis TaxID=442341 RepID=A0A1I3CX19_9GAMM|nr:hypothetical protein SAMN04487959_109140 [Halomonas xianhensis]
MVRFRQLRALMCGCGMLAIVVLPAIGQAAPALRPDMVRSLEAMQQHLSEGETADVAARSRAAAERLEGGNAADRWARALFLQMAATAEARMGNDVQAADLFATARGIEGVDEAQRLRWLNQEARLRLRAGQAEQGGELLESWLKQAGGQAEASDYWLMAQQLANQSQWQAAAEWVDRARQADNAAGNERLELAASIYQRAGRNDIALALLDERLSRGSDAPEAWRRAAALAQRLGYAGRAAALWDAAWRQGVLTSSEDLRQLVQLHLSGGTPARAAEYLEQALEEGTLPRDKANMRLLAEAWTAAKSRDRALEAWRALAERTHAGQDWQRLGELAYGWGRWQAAIDALAKARETGGEAARAWLLEGVAHVELEEPEQARQAFRAARQAGASQAEAWLAVLDGGGEEPSSR